MTIMSDHPSVLMSPGIPALSLVNPTPSMQTTATLRRSLRSAQDEIEAVLERMDMVSQPADILLAAVRRHHERYHDSSYATCDYELCRLAVDL